MIDAETGEPFRLRDDDGNLLVDDVTCQIRDRYTKAILLTASLGNGKAQVLDATDEEPIGIIQIAFTKADMAWLCGRTYDIGCIVTREDGTVEPILDTVAIRDGVVL